MKKIIVLFAFLTGFYTNAQREVLKDIDSFKELKVFDKIQVTLIKADKNEVKITGIKRREVVVVQNGDLLKIRMSLDNLWDNNNTISNAHISSDLRKLSNQADHLTLTSSKIFSAIVVK